MKYTNTTFFALVALLATGITNAADVPIYAGNDCDSSSWVQCGNLSCQTCCIGQGFSAKVTGSDYGLTTAFSQSTCGGDVYTVSHTEYCLRPSFIVTRSVLWRTLPGEIIDDDTGEIIPVPPSGNPVECVNEPREVDSFGYIDEETGEEVVYMIPDDRREAILAAVATGDNAAVKANAAGLSPVSY
ncbi:hypothetical protein FA15DRAFT_697248 [Coprinopsis marcescibilis]|uniref:Uncharacterized protein n=1 Tax=Coprinopsis marcescibilis TaxID=230819 RepID=A0A5C3KI69_COPMA|nr:hypothetical protein FA15DRAFT_697248 [Coprinopsis marcescibilis]